ncbi:MAG: 20S proteasome subunit A/B [Gammaproteobacteria bacterium]
MTYCVGLRLDDGLVFASDSRTNAGVDYVTTYSKMHVLTPAPDRTFVILSAGNLATTQAVVNRVRRDLDFPDGGENLLSARYLFEAAEYLGRVSVGTQMQHSDALAKCNVSGETTLILGGQIGDQPHGLFLIYPQGNYIEASASTPYLQIGETKYGKPVLDRVIRPDLSLEDGARLALVSLNSTAHSNTTVGPPFELSIFRSGRSGIAAHRVLGDHGDFLAELEQAWRDGLNAVFTNLPRFDWEEGMSQDSMAFDEPSDGAVQQQAQVFSVNPGNFNGS